MRAAVLLVAALVVHPAAMAADFGTKRVEIVVTAVAGATTDILARMIGEKLSPRIGQPVVVVNRPGANQQIGAEYVARAEPDGHTLLLGFSALMANPVMFKSFKMDLTKDLAPIVRLVSTPWVFAIPHELPVNNVGEFIAYAKSRSGKVNFGSTGGTVNLDTSVFMMRAGVAGEIINYAGGAPLLTALATNEVQAGLHSLRSVATMPGKVRALAITSPARSSLAPDVPTVSESGLPGFAGAPLWFALWGPGRMPLPLVDQVNATINAILQMPDVNKRIVDTMSAEIVGGSAEDFRQAVKSEMDYYAKAARDAKLVPQ